MCSKAKTAEKWSSHQINLTKCSETLGGSQREGEREREREGEREREREGGRGREGRGGSSGGLGGASQPPPPRATSQSFCNGPQPL